MDHSGHSGTNSHPETFDEVIARGFQRGSFNNKGGYSREQLGARAALRAGLGGPRMSGKRECLSQFQ